MRIKILREFMKLWVYFVYWIAKIGIVPMWAVNQYLDDLYERLCWDKIKKRGLFYAKTHTL